MPPSNIVTAADYADAMMVARRAKNVLFLGLLVMLLAQIGLFLLARKTAYVIPDAPAEKSLSEKLASATRPATAPAGSSTATAPSAAAPAAPPAPDPARQELVRCTVWYVTAAIDFLGILFTVVLAAVLLLVVNIMLIGRLIGVAKVTSAWLWCVLLLFLLFPWQSFLQDPNFTGDFKIPGVLYTFTELTHPSYGAKFGMTSSLDFYQTGLRWARFIGFPFASIVILLVIQAKSSRGLRMALGETEPEVPGEIVS